MTGAGPRGRWGIDVAPALLRALCVLLLASRRSLAPEASQPRSPPPPSPWKSISIDSELGVNLMGTVYLFWGPSR